MRGESVAGGAPGFLWARSRRQFCRRHWIALDANTAPGGIRKMIQ